MLYASRHDERAAQSNRKKIAPPPDKGNRAKNTWTNETAKRAKTGRKTGRGATRELRFAIDEHDFHLAAIEIAHLSNVSPIGLPIYGGAGDIYFSRDIARTDPPGILISRGRFSWRNRAGAGIEPASPDMSGRRDTARVIETLATQGCASPASRRHRSGAFPSYLPDPIALRVGLNPRPLSTSINIHGRRIYGKGKSYIGPRLHDIGTIAT